MSERGPCIVIGVDGGTPTVVEQYVREGALPQIARLMERGTFAQACLPAMPTITPTCWATIATGATPEVHGCTCATLHTPGRPLTETQSAYWSERVQAEFIWETAEQAGLNALVMAYPTSWPARLRAGTQIGGPGCGVVEYHRPETSPGCFIVDGAELQLFSTAEIAHTLATRVTIAPGVDGVLEAELRARTEHSAWGVDPFGWRARFIAEDTVAFTDLEGCAHIAELRLGQWSGDLLHEFSVAGRGRQARYRIKLLDASACAQRLTVYVTPIVDLSERATPAGLGTELNALTGVAPYWHHGALMQRQIISTETFLEIERANFAWRLAAMRHLHEQQPLDLVFQYSVMIDTINHLHRSTIEGYGNADEATRQASIRLERGAYALVDEFVGNTLDVLGPKTTVFLVSDHGSCGYARGLNIRQVLKQAGLLVTRQTATGEEVDWTASRAVPLHCSYVYVNLQGREPHGIVPPSQYERTVDEIIAALYDATDPDTGKRQAALALRRDDARLVGLGGPTMGDVVFAVAGGVGSPGGGVHAGQIPTAQSRGGTQCALLLAAGPGIRRGHRVSRTIRQHQIAPTISALLNIPAPRDSNGALIREMLAH